MSNLIKIELLIEDIGWPEFYYGNSMWGSGEYIGFNVKSEYCIEYIDDDIYVNFDKVKVIDGNLNKNNFYFLSELYVVFNNSIIAPFDYSNKIGQNESAMNYYNKNKRDNLNIISSKNYIIKALLE